MREAKAEGKIKGPAPGRPQSQSARGFGAALRLVAAVPSRNVTPNPGEVGGEHALAHCSARRQRVRHGLA